MVVDARFEVAHLDGVLRLCASEGWTSFPADPVRALRVLTAPGVTTVVALDQGDVVGFAELFSDGELQAYLATMVVDETRRGVGIGRAMVNETVCLAGGERIDLLSQDDATDFYRTFTHVEKAGFRLYPFYQDSIEPSWTPRIMAVEWRLVAYRKRRWRSGGAPCAC